MTRHIIRITASLSVGALVLGLAACGSPVGRGENPGGFRPHPPRDEPTPTSETVEETEPESETTTELPTTLSLDGRDVSLTGPDSVLDFGEPATVATTDQLGRYLVWQVTVHDAVLRSAEDVPLLDDSEKDGIDQFRCYAFDIAFLGSAPTDSDDPTLLAGTPDAARTPVVPPQLLPTGPDGTDIRHVTGSADVGCGIPASNRLPVSQQQLIPGHDYARGILAPDGMAGLSPDGARYAAEDGSSVYWN
ncbi:MAG TPA: hypothetical protein H9870_04300 [Candidatus Corynebacterium avicola]|uniref:Secreted protein n=1 Tax=Candidatus Corynebacterium avicola TaxID=2838527 RepID=A0A9D1ULJ3_9CORY|nr:hypothetical protein [Candidatus Corynebacterium avicola]